MKKLTTITPKFQVHIPTSVRKQVGLKKHGRAYVRAEKSNIIITPVKDDFLSLGGAFKVKNPIKAEKIRKYIDYVRDKR